jgi:ribosomal protein S18 acetylase RimI-like enzyme
MIAPFVAGDIPHFLSLARSEGWICDRWEFDFLLATFPQGCLVWREQGKTLGYITSVRYARSGWIGNLLVRSEARRRGIGRELMEATVAILLAEGVETVWLTASEKGAGLYRKLGFTAIDTIYRWSGKGGGRSRAEAAPSELDLVTTVDAHGWGDRRDALINVTCGRGRIYRSTAGFICCQEWQYGVQIGPWGCAKQSEAHDLLHQALGCAGKRVFLDVPAGNQAATALLQHAGFAAKGSNLLMYLGAEPEYRPSIIYALGSMGSMG